MPTNKYRLINNIGGWIVFAIALTTYWLTLEPTASYWDCGEFIIQADKLEVGHPPGNPIFMLTARFFANFASGPEQISVMVNAMSGLLSALTILLLFWTITHLVRRLVVKDGKHVEPTLQQYLAIMGSGAVGALAYCWSDTFWFSAVEGEVYAFSSFCTALVFWLILKWENRCDSPHSDRWLILIAYIIGVSVAVHLLNLLCIPAIVLVFSYRKFKDMNVVRSLIALAVSFVIIALVLFGLVPGFIKVAQIFELFFVNTCGLPFNGGVMVYAAVTMIVFLWALYELQAQRSPLWIRVSFAIAITLSGMLFFGDTVWIGVVLTVLLVALLFWRYRTQLPVRILNVIMWSVAVIFIGYSSYALILIRASADTPMNQNSPDNVFALASYLNREQYGETPLLYGQTLNSGPMREFVGTTPDTLGYQESGEPVIMNYPNYDTHIKTGRAEYARAVKGAVPAGPTKHLTDADLQSNQLKASDGRDHYVKNGYREEYTYNPELNMVFPRIYSSVPSHKSSYNKWVNLKDTVPENIVELSAIDPATGEKVTEYDTYGEPYLSPAGIPMFPTRTAYKPTQGQNLQYFLNYQLNHMYMRYFMWNFAGRQNDLLNQDGELDAGNWISGIPFIDNARLGDQSYLPDDLGKNNAGHNVYYMLPLLLGIIGLLWQAFAGSRGIEQFWVVFFLFFMTGIAIVLYLNQPPDQPRERDYAFAGSFYAFAIWIGMGVAGLWRIFLYGTSRKVGQIKSQDASKGVEEATKAAASAIEKGVHEEPIQSPAMTHEPKPLRKASVVAAALACAIGILVPIQMVSQTWDDHDRSGRYAARDYGANYLESLEPNAIIFCNGDNDTFPLWYAQEVEGIRPDVKIVNLSYLSSDWYANQQRMPSYTAPAIKMTAKPQDYAYDNLQAAYILPRENARPMLDVLKDVYAGKGAESYGYPVIKASGMYIPVDKALVKERGLVAPNDTALIVDNIVVDFTQGTMQQKRYLTLSEILMYDIIATNAANGWERPIYWATTVGPEMHGGLTPYLRSTGMAHQLVPTIQDDMASRTDRAYEVMTKRYRWGGADAPADKKPYFDETASRMLASMRSSMLDLASEFVYKGDLSFADGRKGEALTEYKRALEILDLMSTKLPDSTMKYGLSMALTRAQLYCELGGTENDPRLNDKNLTRKGLKMLEDLIVRYSQYIIYNQRMAAEFIQPSLTIESQLIPYQYYRFIELYTQYGGKMATVEKLLAGTGINLKVLKSNYDNYRTAQSGGSPADASGVWYDNEAVAKEICQYAEVVNQMASYSPQEYAQASDDEKLIDSMFYQVVEFYRENQGDMSLLESNPQYSRVDMARSKRLSEDYMRNHPEALQ